MLKRMLSRLEVVTTPLFKMPHVESQTLSTLSSKLEQAKPTESPAVAKATGKHAEKGDLGAQEYEEAFEESPRALQGSRTETDIEDADVMEIPEVEAASNESWMGGLAAKHSSCNKPGGENMAANLAFKWTGIFYLEA